MSSGQPKIEGLEYLRTVAARALDEDDYRQELLDDPSAVLQQAGVTVPQGVTVVVYQNTSTLINLVLPTTLEDAQQLNPNETNITRLANAGMHV